VELYSCPLFLQTFTYWFKHPFMILQLNDFFSPKLLIVSRILKRLFQVGGIAIYNGNKGTSHQR
jgi:hypothetical protein